MENKEADMLRLIVDTSKLNKSYHIYEPDPEAIGYNDVINDWHIERIRRLNATANYLIASLQRLQFFGDALSKLAATSNENDSYGELVMNHRAACRDICINIDIYVESITSFCRYYFFMDKATTDDTTVWYQTFDQYKQIEGWTYIENFLAACKRMFKNPDTKFIINIRNKETHNESPLELINYKFEKDLPIPVPVEYVIPNQTLHNKIVSVIELLTSVVASLQELLENISPANIRKYLSTQTDCLENILKPEDRYKEERKYFKQFQCK